MFWLGLSGRPTTDVKEVGFPAGVSSGNGEAEALATRRGNMSMNKSVNSTNEQINKQIGF